MWRDRKYFGNDKKRLRITRHKIISPGYFIFISLYSPNNDYYPYDKLSKLSPPGINHSRYGAGKKYPLN